MVYDLKRPLEIFAIVSNDITKASFIIWSNTCYPEISTNVLSHH